MIESKAERVQAELSERWRRFRAQSAYYQLKVLLVALNVGILFASYIVFWPTSYDFSVDVQRSDLVFSESQLVEVTNLSDDTWYDIEVNIRGGENERYAHLLRRIDPGDTKRIELSLFRNTEGSSPSSAFVFAAVELLKGGDALPYTRPKNAAVPLKAE